MGPSHKEMHYAQLFILLSFSDAILGLSFLREAPDLTCQRPRYQRFAQSLKATQAYKSTKEKNKSARWALDYQ